MDINKSISSRLSAYSNKVSNKPNEKYMGSTMIPNEARYVEDEEDNKCTGQVSSNSDSKFLHSHYLL